MNKRVLLIANIIIPIIIGGIIYYIVSPNVIIFKSINEILGLEGAVDVSQPNNSFEVFVRYYLLDMFWGYSLVFALYFCLGNNAAIKKTFALAFVFSTVMELLQLIPVVPGVFDILDIVVECIAETIAALIIYKHFYEEATDICETKQNG